MQLWVYDKLYHFFYRKYYRLMRVTRPKTTARSPWIQVTDHALHRYLERVKGIDIEQCVGEILGDNLPSRVEKLGQGEYEVSDFRVRVLDNKVVTVLDGTTATSYRPIKSEVTR